MSAQTGPTIIRDGLVLALDAADLGSYPGAGTVWSDLSSNGFIGTLRSGVGYSNDNFGSMVFSGVSGYVECPSVNAMGAIPNQTFETWVKSTGLGPSKTLGGLICPEYGQLSYISNSPSNGSVQYVLYLADGSVPIVSLTTTNVNCFDNRWHHIACTRNDTNAVIYVDGISRASTSGGGAWPGATIYSAMKTQIGNNPNNSIYHLNGSMGLARIYNKALTAAEVLQNYNALKPRFKLN